jgi:hypothetical protein
MVPTWASVQTDLATLPAPAASAGIGSGAMGRSRFHDARTLAGELEPGTWPGAWTAPTSGTGATLGTLSIAARLG